MHLCGGHIFDPDNYDSTGDGIGFPIPRREDLVEVTYNPYKWGTFVGKASGAPVYAGMYALLSNKKVWATRDVFY